MKQTLTLALLAGALLLGSAQLRTIFATSDPAAEQTSVALAGARQLSNAFQEVSERVAPSIVSVSSLSVSSSLRGTRRRQAAQGSGVVVRSDGIVLTNNHVVAPGQEFVVTFGDGSEFDATLIGTDVEGDLAVLRLANVSNVPAVELASDRDAVVGEWVLAMGNPKGLGHTVTAGIVSAIGRHDLGVATFEDFIQTDAAINPGNSGGPLIDLDGRIIGINTAIAARQDGTEGIGFSIPARRVQLVLDDLLEFGRVRRGFLGINMELRVRESRLRTLGYDGPSRVQIEFVTEDGPAAEAGLERGDIVHSIAGRVLQTRSDLLNRVAEFGPGETVEVEVFRDGGLRSLPVRLGERTSAVLAGSAPPVR